MQQFAQIIHFPPAFSGLQCFLYSIELCDERTARFLDWGCLDQTGAWPTVQTGLPVDWQLLINSFFGFVCSFLSACSPHPDLSHGQCRALGPFAASNQTTLKQEHKFRLHWLTWCCLVKIRRSKKKPQSWIVFDKSIRCFMWGTKLFSCGNQDTEESLYHWDK